MQVDTSGTVIARRVTFLVLFFLFLSRVIDSGLMWHKGEIGTFEEKDQANSVTYPSFSMCLLPAWGEVKVSSNETWNFPNSTLDRLIKVKQRLLKNDR